MNKQEERPTSIPSFGAFWAGLILILIMVMVIRKAQPTYNNESETAKVEHSVTE